MIDVMYINPLTNCLAVDSLHCLWATIDLVTDAEDEDYDSLKGTYRQIPNMTGLVLKTTDSSLLVVPMSKEEAEKFVIDGMRTKEVDLTRFKGKVYISPDVEDWVEIIEAAGGAEKVTTAHEALSRMFK